MASKLTLQTVKNAGPREKRYIVWDAAPKGFGLRVNVDGSKTYILKYAFDGRQMWHTIGKHGSPWTPETARKEALDVLGLVRSGIDPAEAARERRAAGVTVAELCDLYVAAARSGQILTKFDTPKKDSTLDTDEGRIRRHIKPLLGKRRVRDIQAKDIEEFLHAVAAGKTAIDEKTGKHGRAIVKGGKGAATRTVGLLGGIFTFAVKKGLRPDNPVKGVQRFKDNKNLRFLSGPELEQLGGSLDADEKAWDDFAVAHKEWIASGHEGPSPRLPGAASPMMLAAIKLLLLTGARRSEILKLEWSHVDLEHGYLRLTNAKVQTLAGPIVKIIPLGGPAVDVLRAIPKLSGSPYVFPATRGDGSYVGLPKAWARFCARAGLSKTRPHDLRHSFASVGASTGNSLPILGAILGHKDPKTTQQYAHVAHDPAKEAAEKVAQSIVNRMKRSS
ncbi:site-specific integrase [Lichenibacterium dinghuense]|uniref:site-specific integrase n=1 Tax=Lichenibacterium dinghuense TaxID=2895977 RepID=UPI001F206024|nr:site-specific integrase [Lichenibacterium sp. 6Y81]